MDSIEIVPIRQNHIQSFHKTLDIVARERRYLSFPEAPPLEATRAFILDIIEQGYPQFVALSGGEVIGWCDVTPKPRPIYAHNAVASTRRSASRSKACNARPSWSMAPTNLILMGLLFRPQAPKTAWQDCRRLGC
jgi:hypothetical protein